ncbi:hypothetical protein M513_11679 [Trichuris suis]|uniref:Uncharacterized protein n=1 Tax=Trichuris suis TaxID=68888 RepID=A0A085LR58_9BILA|nr:hypothetical protein M513_11679 [Trichuris suis]
MHETAGANFPICLPSDRTLYVGRWPSDPQSGPRRSSSPLQNLTLVASSYLAYSTTSPHTTRLLSYALHTITMDTTVVLDSKHNSKSVRAYEQYWLLENISQFEKLLD